MNRFAATLAIGATLFLGTALSGRVLAEEIRWIEDVGAAQREAVQEGKLLLLHFGADDCAPCRNLETTVFIDEQVVAAIHRDFVPVKVDAAARPELCRQFQVSSWPTDVVLTATGEQLYRGVSPPKPHTFRTTLELIAHSARPSSDAVASTPRAGGDPFDPFSPRTKPPSDPDPHASLDRPIDAPLGGADAYAATDSSAAPREQDWAPTNATGDEPYVKYPPEASLSQAPVDPLTFGKPANGVPNFDDAEAALASEPEVAANPYRQVAYGGPGSAPAANYGDSQATTPSFAPATMPSSSATSPPASVAATTVGHSRPSPPGGLRLGLDGNCPMTLFAEETWVKGDPRWGAKHRGVVYLFADAQARDAFLADPDAYGLAWQGIDVVEYVERGRTVPGSMDFIVVAANGFVQFASEQNLARFEADEDYYARKMEELLRSRVAVGSDTPSR